MSAKHRKFGRRRSGGAIDQRDDYRTVPKWKPPEQPKKSEAVEEGVAAVN